MHARTWQFYAPVIFALCAALFASPVTSLTQSVDPAQDNPHSQSVPHLQGVQKIPNPDLAPSATETITQVCSPKVTDNIVVTTAQQRKSAGENAIPPLTDVANGFAWPDTELGVIKTAAGYTFFGSDDAMTGRTWTRDSAAIRVIFFPRTPFTGVLCA